MSDKIACERIINTNHLTGTYGTIDKANAKCFYITLGTWASIDPDVEDIDKLLSRISGYTKNYIRAITSSLSDDYLYSFIDADLGSCLGKLGKITGHISFEVTVMLSKPIANFGTSENLRRNIQAFSELVEEKLKSYPGLSISKRRLKKSLV